MAEIPRQTTPFQSRTDRRWRLRRWYRTSVRPLWRDLRGPTLLFLWLAVLVLGTIGFTQPDGGGLAWWEALIRSFQLFAFAGGEVTADAPWMLNVARVLGPLLIGYAAVRGLLALSREQARLLGMRFLLRNHVIVAGLGDVGFRLASALNDAGAHVVAIDRNATNLSIEGCRERGIGVMVGDATDPDVLRAVRIDRAEHLVVAPGLDAVAIDVIASAARVVDGRRQRPLNVFTHIEDRALWQAMEAWTLTDGSDLDVRIQLFNLYEAAIRLLLAEHPPFTDADADGRRGPNVLVVGDSAIAEILVVNIARLWRNARAFERSRLELTVAGPEASATCERLLARFPQLEWVCRLTAWEIDLDSPTLHESEIVTGAGAIYVAFADEAEGLAAALQLARAGLPADTITLTINDERLGAARLAADGTGSSRIAVFGILSRTLIPGVLLDGLNETLAQAMHDSYRRNQLARGADPASPALAPWRDLHEDLRDSNRAFAYGIPEKMRAIGCVVVPTTLVELQDSEAIFKPPELEELARLEHDRWMRDRVADGWSYGETRDDERKLHPSLIPYAELTEAERDKDRDAIRDLPRMLAEAGFEIHRVSDRGRARAPAGSQVA
jgi:voltage-gated potassium channel Kch